MQRIGIYDARAKFSELIERAAGGEEVVITRRGKPIVKLVSAGSGSGAAVRRKSAAVKRIERMREEFNIRGVNIRKLIEQGRR
jgi:prevent-host-death family protein